MKAPPGIFITTVMVALLSGCASTPEQKQAEEQRKSTAEQQKMTAEQKRWQHTLAPYSDEQLRFKLEGLEQAIARGTEGMNILLRQGNGIGVLIAQGQIEAKVKERDAVGLELVRRGVAPATAPPSERPEGRVSESPKGSGSGFFITEDGYFVTCFHVVKHAARIVVGTKNQKLPARLIRGDEANDLAVLKVDGAFTALSVGSSRGIKLGEGVLTIGFPNPEIQGLEPKLTRGEISSLTGMGDDPREFQISVAVQPGNSGGPLLNQSGAVIGVVASKLSRTLASGKSSAALPENVNYAMKGSLLNNLLESLPDVAAKLKQQKAENHMNWDDIVSEAQAAVAIVLIY